MSQIESPRRIQRVFKATYLSYQPFTYPTSTCTNLQFQPWKWHHPTGIHLAVALESNGKQFGHSNFFWDKSSERARRSYIFGKITSNPKNFGKKNWVTAARLRVSWPSSWSIFGYFRIRGVSKSYLLTYLRILKSKLGPHLTPVKVWTHNDQ